MRSVYPIPVGLAGKDARQARVPHAVATTPELDAIGFDRITRMSEETQLHPGCVLGEESEVGSFAVPASAERSRRS
jgi:hypothetical protein